MSIHPSASVSPTARVHPGAEIGPGTVIGDFCVVEPGVAVGAECLLDPYVYLKSGTTLGDRNQISSGAVLGSDPLDKNFRKTDRSYLRIGNGNVIREHFTISRGTAPESATTIGDENYIMTAGHIAHNCVIGNRVVIASCVLVAGYVEIEDQAFVSGGIAIHQHSKIGRLAMVGGLARVNQDLPPYFLYEGFDVQPRGINTVGLKRAGFTAEEMAELKSAYRILYRQGLKLEEALSRIETELAGGHAAHLVEFIRGSQRGICRPRP